jgi:Leucine-rich repeat (LRR) protein
LSKLKKPEVYGPLSPTATALWSWLRSNGIVGLERTLSLSAEQVVAINGSLELIDLSGQNIVYDALGDDIHSEARSLADSVGLPQLIRDIVGYLKRMKGTFTRINLSNNLLCDEGLSVLVSELKDHGDLEEIDLRDNGISDIGLRKAQDLMKLPKLRSLYLSENYGPSEETLAALVSWAVTPEEQAVLREKIE